MSWAAAPTAWTGGQYSAFRAAFGAYLAAHFGLLAPWAPEVFSNRGALASSVDSPLHGLFPSVLMLSDAPAAVTGLCVVGVLASVGLALGWRDRWLAVLLWYLWACLFGRNPLIANPSLPYVGWMLLLHACLPRAPYGSLEARNRVDPGGTWMYAKGYFALAWAAMALGYSYSGYTKLISPSWIDGSALLRVLENPLARDTALREALAGLPASLWRIATWCALGCELAFAPLALSRRLRPLLWGAMLAMHLSLIALLDFADLSLGMVLLHLVTFDPAWIRPLAAPAPDRMFFDGECGLCHRAVRFVLAEDRSGEFVRFSPLQGATLAEVLDQQQRAGLPDSVIVLTHDGRLLTRSDAILRLGRRLGGLWRVAATLAALIPRAVRDGAYDGVARIRKRLFAAPKALCPLAPASLMQRFDP